MNLFFDYMTRMEDAFQDREAKRQVREDAAFDGLAAEFQTAFYADQGATLRTPGFADKLGGRTSMPFLQYIAEDMSDKQTAAMVRIVAQAAMVGDVNARKLVDDWADDYAKYHCQDAAEE